MFRKIGRDEKTGRIISIVSATELPVAKLVCSTPCMDGDVLKIYHPQITSWQQSRQCAWCGREFKPRHVAQKKQRFCNASCSAKWRMNTPEHKAKVHTKEVAAKRGAAKSRWLKGGSEAAEKEIQRIAQLNPMSNPATRAKVSETLRAMGHKPSVRGGNGHAMTEPQRAMYAALAGEWVPELAISLGKRRQGYPTCYKVDLGNRDLKIGIELDGHTHHSRKEQDAKKDAALAGLGWTVLRFWNKDVLAWAEAGMHPDTTISETLDNHGIKLSIGG